MQSKILVSNVKYVLTITPRMKYYTVSKILYKGIKRYLKVKLLQYSVIENSNKNNDNSCFPACPVRQKIIYLT